MRIVLGCGEKKHNDAVHVDIRRSASPDLIVDLNKRPWPFESESADEVVAEDIIEHLDDVVATIEEIHRVIKTGGQVRIVTPHYQHPNSWHDPSHKWHLTEYSFDYFDPSTEWGRKYSYYSNCKFEITERNVAGGNVHITMRRR